MSGAPIEKARLLEALKTVQDESSRYLLKQPSLPTDPIAVLRNEELVLIRAEVLWGLNRDAEALLAALRHQFVHDAQHWGRHVGAQRRDRLRRLGAVAQ